MAKVFERGERWCDRGTDMFGPDALEVGKRRVERGFVDGTQVSVDVKFEVARRAQGVTAHELFAAGNAQKQPFRRDAVHLGEGFFVDAVGQVFEHLARVHEVDGTILQRQSIGAGFDGLAAEFGYGDGAAIDAGDIPSFRELVRDESIAASDVDDGANIVGDHGNEQLCFGDDVRIGGRRGVFPVAIVEGGIVCLNRVGRHGRRRR